MKWPRTLAFLSLALPLGADPLLSPQEALQKMEVPPGFSVDLLAAEPDLVQPIAFTWDARGRLWVVEGMTYPTRATKPPAPRPDDDGDLSKPNAQQLKDIFSGQDRILIFEDSDGDGSFETRKVFLEKLNLVSGIEIGYGGVYLGAAPYLLYIPLDASNDKPAGDPVILADGWGYQDTHETLNSFIWGPDGWLYGCHGVFTHSEVRVTQSKPVDGKRPRTPLNCAYWRYHPTRHEFEVFASGTSNPWGFDYNQNGDWFSEACVIPHFWHIIQGGYYLRQSNPLGHFNPYVYTNIETIADHLHYIGTTPHSGNLVSDAAGGGHAHCGLLIYNGHNFPEEYRGRAMFFNIHGQRINQENLVPQGSGYVAKHLPDFLKTHDRNFTGVALKVGPDGAVYFIDWYDREKCHRPQPEVWDRTNGRLYRVKYDATWKPWKGDVSKDSLEQLVAHLTSRSGWHARQALQLITERSHAGALDGQTLLEAARRSAEAAGQSSREALFARMESGELNYVLWAMQNINAMPTERLVGFLQNAPFPPASSSWARLIRHLSNLPEIPSGFVEALQAVLSKETTPITRLAIASALQRLPFESRWGLAEKLLQHAGDAQDHNLPQMYWYAIEPLVPSHPERALELAAASKIPQVAKNIARRVADIGNDAALASLVRAIAKEKTGAGLVYLSKAALEGLKGRVGLTPPPDWDRAFTTYDDVIARRTDGPELAAELRDLRTALAVAFGDQRVFPQLRAQVADASLPADRRQAALRTLVNGRDAEAAALMARHLNDGALRLDILKLMPQLPASETAAALGSAALQHLSSFTAEEKSAAINALTTRVPWAMTLLDAVAAGQLDRSAIPSFAARQIADLKNDEVTAKLEKVWGKIGAQDGDLAKMAEEEIAKWKAILTPDFLKGANRSQGRVLYAAICGQCHVLFGEGGKIGPDITGSNRANLDYILENVVNPNALIGADYELVIFSLKDGRTVSGMIRKTTDTAYTVQTIAGEEVVAKADIAEETRPGISMMPMGLFAALSNEQVRDLVAYLASPTQVPLPGEEGSEDGPMIVPGALEGESLKILAKTGNPAPQNMKGFKDSRWSGDTQLWWTGAKPGDRLTLALPVAQAGHYEIKAVFTRAPDYGTIRVLLDGKPLSDKQFDFFGWRVTATPLLTLGERELTAGEHELTFEITGANPEAVKSYMVGLDYLWLEKK